MPNKKQVQFKLVPKIHVYRTIADPKSRVEIVCAKQVVGLCVRQAMMMLRNVPACAVELLRSVVSSRLATMKSAGNVRTVITSARACTRV